MGRTEPARCRDRCAVTAGDAVRLLRAARCYAVRQCRFSQSFACLGRGRDSVSGRWSRPAWRPGRLVSPIGLGRPVFRFGTSCAPAARELHPHVRGERTPRLDALLDHGRAAVFRAEREAVGVDLDVGRDVLAGLAEVAFVPGTEHELHGWMLRLELGVTAILPLLVLEVPDRESRKRRDDSEVRAGCPAGGSWVLLCRVWPRPRRPGITPGG